jgi:acetolactate decarboxylase
VEVVPDAGTTPFAAVTFFEPDFRRDVVSGTDFPAFQQWLDALLPNLNLFYAVRLEGHFRLMKTRSVPAQSKPYPALAEVAKHQPVFDFEDVQGVIVGYRSPAFVKGIGVPGYHLHFLTSDRQAGGHILAFTVQQATVEIEQTSDFLLRLPKSKAFSGVDLGQDRSAELKQVEQER